MYIYYKYLNIWGLGIGDWGLGIGDWGLGVGRNPQSPFILFIIINVILILYIIIKFY